MAFPKTYEGSSASTDYSNSLAWALNSLRNAGYAWTASGSGTAEYYVRTAASANPGFVATPPTTNGVYLNSTAATKGTLGSLATGTWGFGDNDALGYSTVYVRTSAGADPDSLAADYVQFRQIPQVGEDVRVPAGAGSITAGYDQSAVAINGFYVEDGYFGTIASSGSYLRIDPNILEINSLGQSFIDTGITGAVNITVHQTGGASVQGQSGLHLRGTNITLIDARGGSVGIAALPGETATVTTLRMSNRNTVVKCGAGTSLTSVLPMFNGTLWLYCNATTVTKYGGDVYLREAAAITTVNSLGPGKFSWGSSGNITTYNARAGNLDMKASNAARTVTTLNIYSTTGDVDYNKEAVTITNHTFNDSVRATYSAA
jgi:hypothetical protein